MEIREIHGAGMPAVPPFLQILAEPKREQGENRHARPGTWLQKFNGIGGAALSGQIRNEPAPHTTPARLLAPPRQPAAGPGQLLPIKQATARPQNPEAVLTTRTGVNAAVFQQFFDFGSTQDGREVSSAMQKVEPTKSHPLQGVAFRLTQRKGGLSTAPPPHAS